jgi:hypothetical protein
MPFSLRPKENGRTVCLFRILYSCNVFFLIIQPTRCTNHKFILEKKIYIFRTVPLSIIRSYSVHSAMVYVIETAFEQQNQDVTAVPSWPCCCSKALYKPVWHIPLLSVQWITADDGQRNCPKHVEFNFQNKFEKLVHLVGFVINKFVTMHGHMNVKFVLYFVIWNEGKFV